MITSVLSDNNARLITYGPDSMLKLPRPAAVKTGTTDSYRDTWTIGYTPNLTIGVWVGNTDNHPMKEVQSSMAHGKIWRDAMDTAIDYLQLPVQEFVRPAGLVDVEVCSQAMRPGAPAVIPTSSRSSLRRSRRASTSSRATRPRLHRARDRRPHPPARRAAPAPQPKPVIPAPAAPAPAVEPSTGPGRAARCARSAARATGHPTGSPDRRAAAQHDQVPKPQPPSQTQPHGAAYGRPQADAAASADPDRRRSLG